MATTKRPVSQFDVPANVPVAQVCQRGDQVRIIGSGAERAAKPWMRIDTCGVTYRLFRGGKILAKALGGEERHSRVEVRVAADQVSVRDPSRKLGVRLHPSALEEEGRLQVEALEQVENLHRPAWLGWAICMFCVEGQRDPNLAGYFSTPVITTPRMKTRWKIRNRITGTIRVIRVPAWISPGSCAERLALNVARPTAKVWRSGLVDR